MKITDELLFTVDINNNPVSPKSRDEVHAKGYWHRTSHIWVITPANEILCHQRSLYKDIHPGTWQPFFGGHLGPETSYKAGALQELSEELGISVQEEELNFFDVYKSETAKEFIGIYLYTLTNDIASLNYEKEEIEKIQLYRLNELEDIFTSTINSKWTLAGYEKEFISGLVGYN